MTSRHQREIVISDERARPAHTWQPTRRRHRSLNRPRRFLAATAVAVAGALLAACGSDEPTTEGANTPDSGATIEAAGTDQLAFEPDGFTIPAGEDVTLELTADSVEHDFVVEGAAEVGGAEFDQAEDSDDLHVAHADAGDTVTAHFRIDEAGTYTVFCSIPGHRDAGMETSLVVT